MTSGGQSQYFPHTRSVYSPFASLNGPEEEEKKSLHSFSHTADVFIYSVSILLGTAVQLLNNVNIQPITWQHAFVNVDIFNPQTEDQNDDLSDLEHNGFVWVFQKLMIYWVFPT